MRTTINIPDPIYRRLKAVAVAQGCPVKELLLRSVITALEDGEKKSRKRAVKLPIIDSRRPGWLRLTNRRINEIC